MEMDDLDIRITEELQRDARQPSRVIAAKLGVSISTVRRRVRRLIENKVVQMIAVPQATTIGYTVWAWIGLTVSVGYAESVAEALVEYSFVSSVSETLGRFDVVVAARFKTLDELANFVFKELPKIQGVLHSETSLLAKPRKYFQFVFPTENFV